LLPKLSNIVIVVTPAPASRASPAAIPAAWDEAPCS